MRRISLALSLVLCLSGCDIPAASNEQASFEEAPASSSPLEQAALKSGAIMDIAKVSPVGLFQRRHEAGRDALCVMPGEGKRFRFGVEAIFGTEEYCRGEGTARRAGDKLILDFSGRSDCIIVAQYDGDRIAMPGVVDVKCASLCNGRGSLEGVSFPRVSSEAAGGRGMRDRTGRALCSD